MDIFTGIFYIVYIFILEVCRLGKKKEEKFKVLPYITIIELCLGVLVILNFELFTVSANKDSYKEVPYTVTDVGKDALFGIIPRVKLSYSIGGADYTCDKVLYTSLFFRGNIFDNSCYVNKNAPESIMLPFSFMASIWNIALLLIILVSVVKLARNVYLRIRRLLNKRKRRENNEE